MNERQENKGWRWGGWGFEGADSAVRVSFAGRGSRRGDERAAAAGVCARAWSRSKGGVGR